MLTSMPYRTFTGKTESGFKFKTPKMRMRVVKPIFPPPGLNLQIPENMTPELFCKQIGGDCSEYADKFENIQEVFNFTSVRINSFSSLQLSICRTLILIVFIERNEREGSATCTEKIHFAMQRNVEKRSFDLRLLVEKNLP